MTVYSGEIKDFVKGFYDGPHATPKESNEGPIFLGIKNVTPEGRLDFSKIRHISQDEFSKWTKRVIPQKDDIVFSYEATLHRYALIPEGFVGCLGRRMALIRPDKCKVYPKFLHYYFMSSSWRKEVESSIISGATVDRIPLTKVPAFKVIFPNLRKQKLIAEVLSTYDKLIENNRRRIVLLEDAARQLYKEWFVRFRFPGHEHVKMNDGIPEEWVEKTIADVAKTVGGGTPSTKVPEYWEGGDITWFVPKDLTQNISLVLLDSEKKITDLGLQKSSAKMLPSKTILMSSRASIGYFGLYDGVACTNQGFISVIPKKETSRMYILHNLMARKKEIIGLAGGTTYKEINKTTFRGIEILMPPDELLQEFEDFVFTEYQQVRVLMKEIVALKNARDILLPKLMSGDIAV